eukprot:6126581-Lingulodinium_polyedra.AAC.1
MPGGIRSSPSRVQICFAALGKSQPRGAGVRIAKSGQVRPMPMLLNQSMRGRFWGRGAQRWKTNYARGGA